MITFEQRKTIVLRLLPTMIVTYLADLLVCLFGGAHNTFWHIQPPGTVPIKVPLRFGSHEPIYVAPWVAMLHHVLIGIICLAFGVIALIALYNIMTGETE